MAPDPAAGQQALLAVIVDFGGVMTQPVTQMFKHFATATGLTSAEGRAVIAAVYAGGPAGDGAIQRLERGAITPADLGRHLADAIATVTGRRIDAEGLFDHLWGQLQLDWVMVEGVRRLRAAGITTALLSNSWGAHNYPFDDLDGVFDHLVISGDVGLRKPDPSIYELTLDRLDVRPASAVFIDDLPANVRVAVDLGMPGIHHTSAAATLTRLESLFGRPSGSLTGAPAGGEEPGPAAPSG